jgi:hypothetical protein
MKINPLTQPYSNLIIKSLILIIAIFIWSLLCIALKSEYDDNINYTVLALLISILYSIILLILLFRKEKIFNETKPFIIFGLLTSNPICLLAAVFIVIERNSRIYNP